VKWRIYKVPSRWGLPWEAVHPLHVPVMRFHTFEEAIGYADTHQHHTEPTA
jgi:hypothetical protein